LCRALPGPTIRKTLTFIIYQSASGAQIAIAPNGTVTLTRRDGSQVTGTYNPSTYQFNFGANSVGVISANDSAGQVLNTLIGGGQTTEINGGLDIEGNVFTLGSWTNGSGNSINALTLSYTDTTGSGQPSLFNFNATRSSVDWIWSNAQTDGSSNQFPSMMLDNGNRLILYVPASSTTTSGIVLDPVAGSGFQGPLRVHQQGDISMGPFQNGPTPP
jgi:hypothetical protein